MNKHLLSLFVLIGFTLLAFFPTSTKSTIEHSIISIGVITHQSTDFGANRPLPGVKVKFSTLSVMAAGSR
jgi:hypothetical protein